MKRHLRVLVSAAVIAGALGVISPASAARCPPFSIGVDYFSSVSASGATCATARRLLDQTTLTRIRRNRTTWSYAGWRWSLTSLDEMSSRVSGARGSAHIRAVWSKS